MLRLARRPIDTQSPRSQADATPFNVQYDPSNSTAFIKFAELEKELGDLDRARGIFELAISQPLDMPEVLWKAYIDFEYEEEEWDRTRELYKRLLERTSHVKVWISWAQFESNAGKTIARAYRDQDDDEYEEDEEAQEETEPKPEKVVSPEAEEAAKAAEQSGLEQAREVFKKGYKDLKDRQLKQERLILLEAWKALETADGDADSLAKVEAMMPRVVKKRRKVGNTDDMEEYFDLLFADVSRRGSSVEANELSSLHCLICRTNKRSHKHPSSCWLQPNGKQRRRSEKGKRQLRLRMDRASEDKDRLYCRKPLSICQCGFTAL